MTQTEAQLAVKTQGATIIGAFQGGRGVLCWCVQFPDKRCLIRCDADIDWDGSFDAYHPDDISGKDKLAYAGHPGNWWGTVTNNGRPSGTPIIQGATDPMPGFYVSATAYEDPEFQPSNPRRYLNGEDVPFIVVNGVIRRAARGIVLGCMARATNSVTGRMYPAIVGDIGPAKKCGELSPALGRKIDVDTTPRAGGEERNIITYEFWPDTPATLDGKQYNLIRARAA